MECGLVTGWMVGRSVVRLTEIPQIRARGGREEREENRPGSFRGRDELYYTSFGFFGPLLLFANEHLASASLGLAFPEGYVSQEDPDKSGTADLGWIIPPVTTFFSNFNVSQLGRSIHWCMIGLSLPCFSQI